MKQKIIKILMKQYQCEEDCSGCYADSKDIADLILAEIRKELLKRVPGNTVKSINPSYFQDVINTLLK